MIIEAFGNAHYDVTRYPAHVAVMTDPEHQDKFQKLIDQYSNSGPLQRAGRFVLAAVLTFVVPFVVLHYKEPEECMVMSTVTRYFVAEKVNSASPLCVVGLHASIMMSIVAVALGIVYNLAVSLLMSFSLLCTTKLYSLYVCFILRGFIYLRPHMEPVLYTLTKPVNTRLANVFAVWKRLSHPAYLIAYWVFSIVLVVVSHAGLERQITFATCLIWILQQTYLPGVVWILRAEPTLQEAVKFELSSRVCPDVGHLKLKRASFSRSRNGMSDMWWRLFELKKNVFTCSAAEVYLMIEYFQHSHRGVDGKSWPIEWHDRLCITGNSHLNTIYVDDLNLLLTPASIFDKEEPILENPVASDFLQDCKARLEALREPHVV